LLDLFGLLFQHLSPGAQGHHILLLLLLVLAAGFGLFGLSDAAGTGARLREVGSGLQLWLLVYGCVATSLGHLLARSLLGLFLSDLRLRLLVRGTLLLARIHLPFGLLDRCWRRHKQTVAFNVWCVC